MKKILNYLRIWGNDYTPQIYISRMLGYTLAVLYFIGSFGNKESTRKFNRERNYFVSKRGQLIKQHNKPEDDAFDALYLKNDRYDFRGIFLPQIENTHLMRMVYADTLKVYTEKNDDYDYRIVDEIDKIIPEGTYCYVGLDGENILVKPGDVVIDAGAWIGDFSAYASKKGAHAYAFEPSPSNIKLLEKTIEYNKGNGGEITIVPFGLGEKEETLEFFENKDSDNTGGNSFNIGAGKGNTRLDITTVDSWVERNNIHKVDFIKADIEGYERFMLKGARKTLREHSPILSICTYHFPEDPQVLKDIILEANPLYKIIQRKMKLFAYIPK